MQPRTLVAYVTAGGATQGYAEIISDTLRSRGHDVTLVNLKREEVPELSAFDNVVVGMGVRMFLVYRRAKQFLTRSDLGGKPLAVYLSSAMAIDEPEKAKERFLTPLVSKSGLSPVMYDAFPGKMPLSPGKLEDRTNPDVARKWAEELADRLGKET